MEFNNRKWNSSSRGRESANNNEGGWRPRQSRFQSDPRNTQDESGTQSYNRRPRFSAYGQQNGDRPRTGGWQQRPRFNRQGDDAQQSQRPAADGFRPRFNRNAAPDGQPRQQQPRQRFNSGVYSQRKQQEYRQRFEDPDKEIRLNKYLANAGICSRREADDFIQAGVITVNGEVVNTLGAKVKPTDRIMFHDQPIRRERKVYLLLNKPKNTVTTTDDPQERHTVLDIVRNACAERIYPVGRLDRNTTGVLLLTNDGDLAAKLTHPKFGKKKVYAATLDRDLNEEAWQQLMAGIMLDDELIVPDALEFTKEDDRRHIGLEIHSGQNRVVRRMFEKVGYKVLQLDRVSFAGLTKKNVPRGKYRFLNPKEVAMLKMGAFE
ncbi:MAG: rRNA pseudouridine synthase [Paludibacteraceae bacterium]|nr:rRNA pseudouridine synthase [Paludibacteraceae bacterium]